MVRFKATDTLGGHNFGKMRQSSYYDGCKRFNGVDEILFQPAGFRANTSAKKPSRLDLGRACNQPLNIQQSRSHNWRRLACGFFESSNNIRIQGGIDKLTYRL
jgi:hypothetical protein